MLKNGSRVRVILKQADFFCDDVLDYYVSRMIRQYQGDGTFLGGTVAKKWLKDALGFDL